jgi:hypothetical protein
MFASNAEAQYLELDKFSLDIMKFGDNREPMTPDIKREDYLGRVATNFDISILNRGFWRNNVHAEGTHVKFMTVGWHFDMGVKLDQFELFYSHHSRHTMDRDQPMYFDEEVGQPYRGAFPVEDSYGVRIILYEKK